MFIYKLKVYSNLHTNFTDKKLNSFLELLKMKLFSDLTLSNHFFLQRMYRYTLEGKSATPCSVKATWVLPATPALHLRRGINLSSRSVTLTWTPARVTHSSTHSFDWSYPLSSTIKLLQTICYMVMLTCVGQRFWGNKKTRCFAYHIVFNLVVKYFLI